METDLYLEKDEVTLSGSAIGQSFSQPVVQLLPEQQVTLELLSHLASYSELLIVVSGSAGIGKTTLATALSAQREEPEDTLSLNADLMTSQIGILTSLAGHWDLPQLSDNLAEAKDAVKQAADRRHADGRSTLVVIDQAEQLDSETLNDIAHLALLSPQALSFALFGTRGFENNLRESPTLAPVHVVKLEPLSEQDAQLLSAQVFGTDTLTDDQIRTAHERSDGLPLLFLRELEDVLLDADPLTEAASGDAKSRFPVTHIIAVCGVAAALMMSFLYQGEAEPELSAEEALLATLESSQVETEPVFSEETVVDDSVIGTTTNSEPEPPLATATVVEVTPEKEPDFNYQPSQNVVTEAAESTQITTDTAQQQEITQVSENSAVQYSANEQALLNATGFVAQLSGFYNIAGAESFIARWRGKIGSDLFLYKSQHKGKDWHVVVAGIYPNRAAADQAVAAMPKPLRSQTPWIKDVQTVQKLLKDR